MKNWICFICFLLINRLSVPVSAQAVYEPFNVDSVASPRGGNAMLETFLGVNVRKPFMAQVANATGRVYVKAVVNPNGRVSDVTVIKGFRPDCNREAVRVMGLFNAWKPAIKAGKAVSQTITYPVVFRSNKPVVYQQGTVMGYYDANSQPIDNPLAASYVQTIPVDTLTGIPNGDMVINEMRGGIKRSEVSRYPLVRNKVNSRSEDDEATYQVGNKAEASEWIGLVYVLRANGSLVSVAPADRKLGQAITYNQNGGVESIYDPTDRRTTRWFPSGLLRSIVVVDTGKTLPASANRYRLIAAWDSTGIQRVKNGNGHHEQTESVTSRANEKQSVRFVESGTYTDGVKTGRWQGTYSDGSYTYEETFADGKSLGGTATVNGSKTITYAQAEQNPEFKGGAEQLYAFMGRTIRYPPDAAKRGVQGKVYVSFTVNKDGSLSDCVVEQGVYPSMDAEALRVVKAMSGRWQPGYQRGEPVRVNYNLPISFQLE